MFFKISLNFNHGAIDPRSIEFLMRQKDDYELEGIAFSDPHNGIQKVYIVEEDGVYEDIVGVGAANRFLVSEFFANVLEESGFTGCFLFPIDLMDVKMNRIDHKYYGFGVNGRCGPLRFHIKKSERGKDRPEYYKVSIDEASWDGSDIFRCTPPPDGGLYCVEKVKTALEDARLSNLCIDSLVGSYGWYGDMDSPDIIWED